MRSLTYKFFQSLCSHVGSLFSAIANDLPPKSSVIVKKAIYIEEETGSLK